MIFSEYNAGDILWLGDWSPAWIALLVILGLLVIGISIYDLRPMRARRRWTLVGLRAAVYAMAVLLLLEPALDLKNVTKVKNNVAVLVDASRSMSLRTGDGDETRFDRAAQAVADLDIPPEGADSDHIYSVFTFGEKLASSSPERIGEERPIQNASNLTEALEQVREQFERSDLGGVVIASDGIDTGGIGARVRRGEALDETTKQALRALDAPVNTLAAASSEDLRDVAITRIVRDDFAFVHNKVSIRVELQAVGVEPTSFPVTLAREGELLQTREVSLKSGQSRYAVEFEFVPKKIGKEIYTVSVPEFRNEVLYENNVGHFIQKVIRDKIRVLQVVGRPSWDERFLRQHLKRNPNVDLISFFILRTNENVQMAPTSELSLIPFPTDELFREELGSFDLVIFQNFNFGPYNMRQYLDSIAGFVKEGGGFVMIGGDLSFSSGGYARTPIEEILPVELPPRGASNVIDEQPFRPRLTEAGTRHPITQLAFDPVSNRKIWERLPEQQGTNIVMRPRERATVLATHPRLTAGDEPMPVITVSEMGDGRVMAITTDSTWRWGFESLGSGGTPREYQVFWNSSIRWLIKDPELKLLKIEMAEDVVAPGSRLQATVRVSKPDYTPAPSVRGELVVSRRDLASIKKGAAARETVARIPFETSAAGEYQLDLAVDAPGVYEIVAQARTSAGELRDQDVFLSVPDVREYRDIVPRDDLLEAISQETGGHHAALPRLSRSMLAFNPPRMVQVNRRTVIHIWDSFFLFGLIVALLGLEWTLRRRWGRL